MFVIAQASSSAGMFATARVGSCQYQPPRSSWALIRMPLDRRCNCLRFPVGVAANCKPETFPGGVGQAPENAERNIPAPLGFRFTVKNRSRSSKHTVGLPEMRCFPQSFPSRTTIKFGNPPLDAARHLERFRTGFAPDEKPVAPLCRMWRGPTGTMGVSAASRSLLSLP